MPCEVTIFGVEFVRATAAEAWVRRVMAGHPRAVIAFGAALLALTWILALAPSWPALTKLLVAWNVGAVALTALTVQLFAARFVHGWSADAVARRDGEQAVTRLVLTGSALGVVCAVSASQGFAANHEAVVTCRLGIWTMAASSLLALATLAIRHAVAAAREAFAPRLPALHAHTVQPGRPPG